MASPARVLIVDDSPTILKVVSAILTRNGYEAAVARDGIAGIDMIKRGPKFDLVLLDFVMPRMNGYQFCRELRSNPAHRSLPVVLMSAKGDKIRGQFVQQTGAVDAITKPFDARALVAVIEGALAKTAEGRARPVPEGQAMPDEDTIQDSVRPQAMAKGQKQRAAIQFAQQIAAAVVPSLLALPQGDRGNEAALLTTIVRSFTSDVMGSLVMTLRDMDQEGTSREVLTGDIAAIPLAEVLQVLQMQRQTGVIRISNQKSAVTIYLRQGLIDLVQSRGLAEEFRLGRYFIEKGHVHRDELEDILKDSREGEKLIGESLVLSGKVKPEEVQEALERQSSELVYDMLRWAYGRFSFTREAFRPEAEAARLGLSVAALVLEGFRRVDEWRLMETTINFDQVVYVDPAALDSLGEDKLTRPEKLVLEAVNGQRTVSQVIKESHVGSFDAIKILYQFLQSRVLRSRAQQQA
ncbi:MAG: response regulator [Polyangiaceae bacterium]